MYARNIVVQPGPLSVPPENRSLDEPSYRIIDFGRGKTLGDDFFSLEDLEKEAKGEERSAYSEDLIL
jgi:hypothetical protein